jgi:Spy/CpxP family protein refolding chaperone
MNARMILSAVVLVFTATAHAQDAAPQFNGFNGIGVGYAVGPLPERLAQLFVALLNHGAVKDELKLTPDQAAVFEKLKEETRTSLAADLSGAKTREEVDRARVVLRARLDAAAKDVHQRISAALQPEQLKRLTEISVQMRNLEALADPTIAKELGLTDEQFARLAAISDEARAKLPARRAGVDRRTARAQARQEVIDQVSAVLTPDQKAAFEKLKGKRTDIKLSSLFEQPR